MEAEDLNWPLDMSLDLRPHAVCPSSPVDKAPTTRQIKHIKVTNLRRRNLHLRP